MSAQYLYLVSDGGGGAYISSQPSTPTSSGGVDPGVSSAAAAAAAAAYSGSVVSKQDMKLVTIESDNSSYNRVLVIKGKMKSKNSTTFTLTSIHPVMIKDSSGERPIVTMTKTATTSPSTIYATSSDGPGFEVEIRMDIPSGQQLPSPFNLVLAVSKPSNSPGCQFIVEQVYSEW